MPRGRKALIIIGVVIVVLAAALIAYSIWERPPQIAPTPAVTASPAPAEPKPAGTDKPDDPEQPVPMPEPTEIPAEKDPDALVADRDSGKYTVLVVGRDHASNSTDTILVVRLDTKAHRIDCVSIPRDTMINIGWATTPKRINAVYPGCVNSG